MNLGETLHKIFEADKDLLNIRAELAKLRAEGIDREVLIAGLRTYHDELESEADQDLVLDALDFLHGWCRTDLRID